jgi:hypothetical protein
MGDGTNGPVASLTVFENSVFVGGTFTTAGGVEANNVARYRDGTWAALGSGTGGSVTALEAGYGVELYVGGSFSVAGGKSSARIARWADATSALEEPQAAAIGLAFPNPYRASDPIRLSISDRVRTDIAIYDVLGRRVRTLHSNGEGVIRWDGRTDEGRAAPAGAYIVGTMMGCRRVHRPLTLLR